MHAGQTNGPIRLWRNGSSSLSFTSGRVQLVYNSQWGNICDDVSFGITEATVICHQLGYTGASSYSRARNDLFGNDSSLPTLLSNVSCSTSSYLVILQCSYDDTPPSSCTDADLCLLLAVSKTMQHHQIFLCHDQRYAYVQQIQPFL